MQGGGVPAGRQEEARSEAYLDVRCTDERPLCPFERGLRSRKLGEVRKGGVPPSEESLRRRWAFFNSLVMHYPFTAIVGQEPIKLALLLNAINPLIGGVLIQGEKGTAKSTTVRALAQLLPALDVVADCPYACATDDPDVMCAGCRRRREQGETLPVVQRPMRVVELPLNASEDRGGGGRG